MFFLGFAVLLRYSDTPILAYGVSEYCLQMVNCGDEDACVDDADDDDGDDDDDVTTTNRRTISRIE